MPNKTRVTFVLFIVLGVLPQFALAQPPPPTPPEREGSAEFAFVGTAGNSSTRTIGLGGEIIYRPSPWESKVKVSYVRNEADDQLKAQAFALAARVQHRIAPRLAGYAQYGYQHDRFAGLLARNAVEVGLAYSWIARTPHRLIADAGLGYANEQRLFGNNLSTATLGTGGIYTLKISDTSDLSEDGHLVCSLSDGSDWRYANAIALTAKVSTRLSLKVSNTIRYVNLPVPGFKRTDAVTAVALVAKF
jgi:putative salt-induced outer membrane protein YdiY